MSFSTTKSPQMMTLASTELTSPAPPASRASISTSSSDSTQVLTQDDIEKKPWKYIGYKGYAELLASENDFYIFRKFATLNSRIALALQDQLSELEEKLGDLDKQYSKRDAEDLHNGSFRDDREDRKELVGVICSKLIEYSQCLSTMH
jgi:hypothetical protein